MEAYLNIICMQVLPNNSDARPNEGLRAKNRELKITFFSQTPLSCFVPTFLVEEQLACHMLAVIGCCGVVVSGWWPLRGCGILCAFIGLGAHPRPTATHSVHAVSTS